MSLEVRDAARSFGKRVVFRRLGFELSAGERLMLTGAILSIAELAQRRKRA